MRVRKLEVLIAAAHRRERGQRAGQSRHVRRRVRLRRAGRSEEEEVSRTSAPEMHVASQAFIDNGAGPVSLLLQDGKRLPKRERDLIQLKEPILFNRGRSAPLDRTSSRFASSPTKLRIRHQLEIPGPQVRIYPVQMVRRQQPSARAPGHAALLLGVMAEIPLFLSRGRSHCAG
jgi:hypothetical protein